MHLAVIHTLSLEIMLRIGRYRIRLARKTNPADAFSFPRSALLPDAATILGQA
jgi:hypothetical protein